MWFAVLPAQNKFIYSESKGELIGLANNIWYGEKYMIISEQGFNEIYADQVQKGNKMVQVIVRSEKQPRRSLPRLPTQPIPVTDVHNDIIDEPPKESISDRAMRRLSNPKMMSHITKPHPFSHKAYRR